MLKIKANLSPRLPMIRKAIKAGFSGEVNAIQDAFKQWALRYRSAMQLRFNTNSRGGGEWPPLKAATIKARQRMPITRLRRAFAAGDIDETTFNKRLKSARSRVKRSMQTGGAVSILRDTGLLFNTLSPAFQNLPGQVEHLIPKGIEVGIGGPASHGVGPATIGDIATYHHTGAGNLPERTILVQPPAQTIVGMRDDLERAIMKIIESTRAADAVLES